MYQPLADVLRPTTLDDMENSICFRNRIYKEIRLRRLFTTTFSEETIKYERVKF